MNDTALNNQTIDGMVSAAMMSVGASPAASMAMLDLAMTESVAAAMRNAVARQQQSSISGATAAVAVCSRLLGLPLTASQALKPEQPHDR